MEPKTEPKWSPRAFQDALGARLPAKAVFGGIFRVLGGPRNPKNHAPATVRAQFRLKSLTAPGLQNRAQQPPKIEPKTLPGGFKMASKRVSKNASILAPMFNDFLLILEAPGGRAEGQNGLQNRFKNGLRCKAPFFQPRKPSRSPF